MITDRDLNMANRYVGNKTIAAAAWALALQRHETSAIPGSRSIIHRFRCGFFLRHHDDEMNSFY
jgi:hypothetical protein